MGTRSKPFYRMVVSDSRAVPTGRVLESLGVYDPRRRPAAVRIDVGRADYWMEKGAQASATVRGLLERARGEAPAPLA
jgi:small subunit ribosomal protein S16